MHFHLPSRAPMVPDYLDDIPLQDQTSSVLRVAEKIVVVMAKYDDTLLHHYKLTVLDFAEVDDTRFVVPDTSMQEYHVQNLSNESYSVAQQSPNSWILMPHWVLHPHSYSASNYHHHHHHQKNYAIDNDQN